MLTVLVATHNGEDTLERTLAAFAELVPPTGGWKLVIVDNASSDRTPAIIASWADRMPIDSVKEPRLGKSSALNTGLTRVSGDFVVFADDDVMPDPIWLVEWRRVADSYPECQVFGGSIIPEYEVPPPVWLRDRFWLAALYAVTRPDREGPLASEPMDIFGPNMAIRTSVLDRGIRFHEGFMVGPSGLLGDETDLVNRAVKAGCKVGFAPTALVQHIVQRHQLTWWWMLNRFYRGGRKMFFTADTKATLPHVWGVPRYLVRRIATRLLWLPVVALSFDPARIFSHLTLIASDLGEARQSQVQEKWSNREWPTLG